MSSALTNLANIRHALTSVQPADRRKAMYALAYAAGQNSKLVDEARPIFMAAILIEDDAITAAAAARGLKAIGSAEQSRDAWHSLMTRPDAAFASGVAAAIDDETVAPLLMRLLDRRDEIVFRSAGIRTLGRLKFYVAVPLLLRLGEISALQADVICAFADLGNPQAIPWISRFIYDHRPLPDPFDGDTVRTYAELAALAIRRLQSAGTANAQDSLAAAGRAAQDAQVARRRPGRATRFVLALRRLPALALLTAVIIEVIWLTTLWMTYRLLWSDPRQSPTASPAFNALAPLPAMVGLTYGVVMIAARRARGRWQKIAIILGILICGGFVYVFGNALLSN